MTDPDHAQNLHFYLQLRGQYYYRWRDHDEFALPMAIDAFERQIALSSQLQPDFLSDGNPEITVAHAGFRQMRIIEEKRGNYQAAIDLCRRAKAEGWRDPWDKHIARIEKKMAKTAQRAGKS